MTTPPIAKHPNEQTAMNDTDQRPSTDGSQFRGWSLAAEEAGRRQILQLAELIEGRAS